MQADQKLRAADGDTFGPTLQVEAKCQGQDPATIDVAKEDTVGDVKSRIRTAFKLRDGVGLSLKIDGEEVGGADEARLSGMAVSHGTVLEVAPVLTRELQTWVAICEKRKLDSNVEFFVDDSTLEAVEELEEGLAAPLPDPLRTFLLHTKGRGTGDFYFHGHSVVDSLDNMRELIEYNDAFPNSFFRAKLAPLSSVDCDFCIKVMDMDKGDILMLDFECDAFSVMHDSLQAALDAVLEDEEDKEEDKCLDPPRARRLRSLFASMCYDDWE